VNAGEQQFTKTFLICAYINTFPIFTFTPVHRSPLPPRAPLSLPCESMPALSIIYSPLSYRYIKRYRVIGKGWGGSQISESIYQRPGARLRVNEMEFSG